MIGAYAHGFGFTGLVFRFVSILGERYTHGHVVRLLLRAQARPERGCECSATAARRSPTCTSRTASTAILTAVGAHEQRPGELAVYNLGTDETVVVNDSIAMICEHMGVEPALEYAGGRRGWPGDSPLIHLDCARIRALGLGARR